MVRCGAVAHPQAWRWCGYQELMGLRKRYRVLDVEQLLHLLGGVGLAEFRQHYAALIEAKLAKGAVKREAQWTESIAVGSERFVRSIESKVRGRQELEIVSAGDCWLLREAERPYRTNTKVRV
jgi:putative transposase